MSAILNAFQQHPYFSDRPLKVVVCPDGPTFVMAGTQVIGSIGYGQKDGSPETGYLACNASDALEVFQSTDDVLAFIIEHHIETGRVMRR
jgi:hypothetical protein